jgi:hypothetical protein
VWPAPVRAANQVSIEDQKLRLVARTLVDNAIDGDTTAARECFDRMDGKVPQSANATQARGDITVTWVRPAY